MRITWGSNCRHLNSAGRGLVTSPPYQYWPRRSCNTTPESAPARRHQFRSVSKAIAEVISTFGPIDVLVNNAGIGVVGAFETTPLVTVREVFETNTFGVMAMTHAVLPLFRERRCGVVVNVTSSETLARMPLATAYTASKAAIEGFTGSLAFEMEWFNVRVKLVEPGYAPSTRFTSNGASRMQGLIPEAYAPFAARSSRHSRNRLRRQPSPTWRMPCGGLRTTRRDNSDSQRVPMRWRWLGRDE
jgi:NAD(P)-dependent dehydrogenase (short-subunit alcohol dehydrogenase family)